MPMITTINFNDDVKVNPLDDTLSIESGSSMLILNFTTANQMEVLGDNLISMAQAKRNEEFEMIGGKDNE